MHRNLALSAILLLASASLWAQQPAPRDTATVKVMGKEVSIEYGRPSLKGRSFASLMSGLPADRMWRAGSEQITTLKTAADLIIGGQRVPAGKYSLYVHVPESGPNQLAINKVLGQPLGDIWAAAPPALAKEPWPHFNYDKEIKSEEVARIPLQESPTEAPVDLFTISLRSEGGGARLTLAWGDQSWSTNLAPAKPEGSHDH